MAEKLKIIPLGGLNEIGKNMTVLEYGKDIIVVDCGLGFPEDDMYGVDLVIPDVTYLAKNQKKLRGFFITHGHEDHIGALPYVLQAVNAPVHATPLTLGLIKLKLEEHDLVSKTQLVTHHPGDVVKAGCFSVEFIHVNHSIADAVAFAIHTPVGTVIMTGDFKIDPTSEDGMTDLGRFGMLGKEGVYALLCDSTNVERQGYTPSESVVSESLDRHFKGCKNRIIVTTFASNMHRIQAVFNIAHRHGRKVAVIGSGPAGLACASDLARMGYEVKIFEALHKVGGVLVYGIPEFRLPKERIVAREIAQVERLGVGIETDVIVGRTVTIDSLLDDEGYDAVFIGSGAGLPRFMGIPGENLNGVVSANEFLTRANLMHAYDKAYDTPIYVGQRVVVVGGGNVAMDAVRTAKRLGAEATIVYRRSEKELPARVEEVHHAKEEGIRFRMLTNPTAVLGDEKGWVTGLRCVEMELGEPDESGRRSPVVKEGSEFEIECDVVIMALGTSPNPLLAATTAGLETTRRGCITADERGATTRPGVFAGGDAVTGAATVILAMGAGRTAAKAIDEYVKSRANGTH